MPVLTKNELFDSVALEAKVKTLVAMGERYISVDLSPLEYIYSDSINKFIGMNNSLIVEKGRFVIVAPHNKVFEILTRAGIDKQIKIIRSLDELNTLSDYLLENDPQIITKSVKEIAKPAAGKPIAAAEKEIDDFDDLKQILSDTLTIGDGLSETVQPEPAAPPPPPAPRKQPKKQPEEKAAVLDDGIIDFDSEVDALNADIADIPAIPDVSAEIDIPDISDISAEIDIPDVSDITAGIDIPDISDISAEADIPLEIDIPDAELDAMINAFDEAKTESADEVKDFDAIDAETEAQLRAQIDAVSANIDDVFDDAAQPALSINTEIDEDFGMILPLETEPQEVLTEIAADSKETADSLGGVEESASPETETPADENFDDLFIEEPSVATEPSVASASANEPEIDPQEVVFAPEIQDPAVAVENEVILPQEQNVEESILEENILIEDDLSSVEENIVIPEGNILTQEDTLTEDEVLIEDEVLPQEPPPGTLESEFTEQNILIEESQQEPEPEKPKPSKAKVFDDYDDDIDDDDEDFDGKKGKSESNKSLKAILIVLLILILAAFGILAGIFTGLIALPDNVLDKQGLQRLEAQIQELVVPDAQAPTTDLLPATASQQENEAQAAVSVTTVPSVAPAARQTAAAPTPARQQQRQPQTTQRQTAQGAIEIITEPAGAQIFMNDNFIGRSPHTARNVPRGRVVFRARLHGYRDHEWHLEHNDGSARRLTASLQDRATAQAQAQAQQSQQPQTPPHQPHQQQAQARQNQQTEHERLAREREQSAREQAERYRFAREQAERDQAALNLARDQAERDRLAREQAQRDRLAHEQAERERLAHEQAQRERLAHEQAQRERLAHEQAQRERLAQDQAERERLAREQAERERLAREQAERERLAREQAARDQAAREQSARDQAAREQIAREQAQREERERLAREEAERLAAQEASILFNSQPPNAEIFHNGVSIGRANVAPIRIRPGEYTFEFRRDDLRGTWTGRLRDGRNPAALVRLE